MSSVSKKNVYKYFQQLCVAIGKGLKVDNAILDGEIVCVGPDGRPVFNQLLYRRGNPYFYAFDILWLNGRDLRKLVLVQRKQELRRLIPKQPFPVLYADHQDRHGAQLYEAACSLDLEGIVAKWKYGPYVGDDVATSWVKIKNPAYSQSQGRHEQFTKFRRLSLS
jgi:bifunctional non-homologous end joining protein LigD